jgi:hypothetical protein
MSRPTNRQVDPEVWFRIVHLAQDAHSGTPVATYREQLVEIALGPSNAAVNGKIGTLARQLTTDRIISACRVSKDLRAAAGRPQAG